MMEIGEKGFWSGYMLNDCKAKSAIQLCSPEVWRVIIGEAWHDVSMMCHARMQMTLAAFTAFVARSFVAQATVGVLLHQATWALEVHKSFQHN